MIGSSISSMNAHSVWMDVNANNVANVNSDKFRSTDTKIESDKSGNPTAVLRDSGAAPMDRSNTDLAKEMTDQVAVGNGFAVNASVVRTKDEMLGTLMDIKS